jgi:EAL domain-containing protein (putative c-di-GMP-specific phosphodiesterase class I)/CheY-like chemotaxis protein
VPARILVVDDSRAVTLVLARTLDAHHVTHSEDPAEALERGRNAFFDVVISDYEMPGLNGLEFLRAFRDLQPGCPRILLSGHLDMPTILEAVNEGLVTQVLVKPTDADALRAAVEDALRLTRERVAVERRLASRERRERYRLLRDAILQGTLTWVTQAIVDGDEQPVGFELLARCASPTFPSPADVIRAAEEFGLLGEVSRRCFAAAATLLAARPGRAFINLHPSEFASWQDLVQRAEVLAAYADRVVLEITERASVLDFAAWREGTAALRAMGFALAVDDLGAGYSSLSVLAEVQPEFIKLDMSLVRGVDTSRHKQRLVELFMQFAQGSGAILLAEGIETEAEVRAIRALGPLWMQGYYFGRPG